MTKYTFLLPGDYNWKGGFVSGAVYNYNPELIKLLTEVYGRASYTNPLHPDVFPGVCKMEAEVVRITANLFHGGPSSCGTV
jgi:sphinganine-1-phosphate aldolase